MSVSIPFSSTHFFFFFLFAGAIGGVKAGGHFAYEKVSGAADKIGTTTKDRVHLAEENSDNVGDEAADTTTDADDDTNETTVHLVQQISSIPLAAGDEINSELVEMEKDVVQANNETSSIYQQGTEEANTHGDQLKTAAVDLLGATKTVGNTIADDAVNAYSVIGQGDKMVLESDSQNTVAQSEDRDIDQFASNLTNATLADLNDEWGKQERAEAQANAENANKSLTSKTQNVTIEQPTIRINWQEGEIAPQKPPTIQEFAKQTFLSAASDAYRELSDALPIEQ